MSKNKGCVNTWSHTLIPYLSFHFNRRALYNIALYNIPAVFTVGLLFQKQNSALFKSGQQRMKIGNSVYSRCPDNKICFHFNSKYREFTYKSLTLNSEINLRFLGHSVKFRGTVGTDAIKGEFAYTSNGHGSIRETVLLVSKLPGRSIIFPCSYTAHV